MALKQILAGQMSKLANVRLPSKGALSRTQWEKVGLYSLIALLAFATADLGILNFRDLMLPSQAPPASPFREDIYQQQARMEFESIISRNPFSSDGVIPEPIGSQKGSGQDDPVPTALPIQLVGTLVHSDGKRSVATVALSGGNKVIPYRVGENIEGIGRVEKIERRKVVFRNRNAYDRLEYVEIKATGPTLFGLSKAPQAGGETIQVSGDTVKIDKSEVMKQLNNLPELLNQASTVPNFVPGSGGKINGFRIVNMAPGSVFEKLGVQKFDVIKSVNGEVVDSPAKAMELYNQLKNSNQVVIGIERNGADQSINFSITE